MQDSAPAQKSLSVSISLFSTVTTVYVCVYVGSYDVQSIVVDSPAPNAVTLDASYLKNSPAMGVVFVLLFTDDAGSVNFTKSLYLVLDNVQSSGFIQHNVTRGEYSVVAFDVESNGRPWNSSAAQDRVITTGEG